MSKTNEEISDHSLEDMVKKGTINILALGYKGVEAWREKREPIPKKENKKEDRK